jgi:bifunctional DNA-binding transcriptional regulator/antitoxin component of YhaV-PrlF toxin-antitoxin module
MKVTVDEQGAIRLPTELLKRLGAGPGSELIAESSEHTIILRPVSGSGAKPLWQLLAEAAEALPPEVLDKLPHDGAEEHDHTIYGTPKRSTS